MNKHGNLKWQGGNKTGSSRNQKANGPKPTDTERPTEHSIPEANGNASPPEAERNDEVDGNRL